ncbi:ShlB/FhaC/HecB family hemolysin secretion/activation protein [Alcaligenes sp. SDU_A2]|uniref:ShlB/FhaC/HecB family hemolysin secretion/activation protein n=1 Tax=Alcaligenes sp. SDU_A2 TaxID=3136634 RepID=UPI00311F0E5C
MNPQRPAPASGVFSFPHKHTLSLALLAGLTAGTLPSDSHADAPLRGNPVDSLPPISAPAPQTPTAPLAIPANSRQSAALQARLQQSLLVRSFDVSGSRSIPFEQITAILEPLAGKRLTIAELIKQVNRITTLYQEQGYPLSFAILQEQSFTDGHVKVTVVEGHVAGLRIDGDPGRSEARIRRVAQAMLDEKPLTQRTLERTMNLLRTIPGLKIDPKLDMPSRTDGASELVIAATHNSIAVNASVAEMGSSKQGIVQLSANSLTPLGEELKLTAAIPTSSEDVKYISGTLSIPLSGNGLSLDIDGYHYRSQPRDEVLESQGWRRKVINERIGAALSYPFILNNQRSLKGNVGFYASRSLDDYTHEKLDQVWIENTTDVRALKAELRYTDASARQSREVNLGVYKGLDAMGARKTLNTYLQRDLQSDLDLDFTRWTASLKQNIVLPGKFGLSLSASGQYSNNVLPNSEQISFGAWRHGYGYPQGELAGDKGLGATLELNRRFTNSSTWLNSIQPYIAYDWARAWYNLDRLNSYNNRQLRSAALGVRLSNNKHYLFDINVARPLGDLPVNSDKRKVRVNTNFLLFYDGF